MIEGAAAEKIGSRFLVFFQNRFLHNQKIPNCHLLFCTFKKANKRKSKDKMLKVWQDMDVGERKQTPVKNMKEKTL